MVNKNSFHKPVLREELLEAFDLTQFNTVIDATLGFGGHARGILRQLGDEGELVAFERDPRVIDKLNPELLDDARLKVINESYRKIRDFTKRLNLNDVQGIYFDLGLSSYHLDESRRGFSFQDREAPLDCRFNSTDDQPAYTKINGAPLDEISRVLREFGEVRNPKRIVQKIDRSRPFKTVGELKSIVESVVPAHKVNGELARVFQAVRIWVNDELKHLRQGLKAALDVLSKGGRVVVISYHSLEDRIVKNFFREEAKECICPPDFPVCACDKVRRCRVVTKSPIRPGKEEIEANSRARSAKMRIAEKL